MKPLLNLLRAVVFTGAIFLLLVFIFYCFALGGIRTTRFIGEVWEKINPVLFWVLFLVFGIAILYILWFLFKYITMFIIVRLTKICPYRRFAVWVTGIISVVFTGIFLYKYWIFGINHLRFQNIIFGIILTAASIQVCFLLIYGVIVSYEIEEEEYRNKINSR
jgi:hypothetical protein